jgi:uncharacterized SAM-binding protein YcdF (DUF218 family)
VKRLAAFCLACLLGAAILSAAGFGCFVRQATIASPWPGYADGIVVLTGGAQRVETALLLLRAGVADRLLISGVGPGVTLPELLQNAAPHGLQERRIRAIPAGYHAPGAGRITLGHSAQSTAGNAIETAWWVRQNGLRSLVVVTAGYHMPRAVADLRASLPDTRLTPYAVHPGAGLRTMLVEYAKLVAAEFGVRPAGAVRAAT